MRVIPSAAADVSGNEATYALDAIRSTWISSTGKYLDRFEKEFSQCCNTRYALSCCNGTTALHLALSALGLKLGDEVIVPSLTYIATANAVRYCGAEPVFVDVDPDTWCIAPGEVEKAVTSRTRGIIPVHLMGHPADMDAINAVADRHGLWVVEDASEAHFARYKGRPVGSLGNVATFSFYGNKILTCGEGGAVTSSDKLLYGRMKMLRGQGMDPRNRHLFPVTGYNYRLTNVACAILCGQLERHLQIVDLRHGVFRHYRQLLDGVPGIQFQPVAAWAQPAPWMFCIVVQQGSFGKSRNELYAILKSEGIDSRLFFFPVHKQKPFQGSVRSGHKLLVTEELSQNGLMLPTFNRINVEQLERISGVIRRATGRTMTARRAA